MTTVTSARDRGPTYNIKSCLAKHVGEMVGWRSRAVAPPGKCIPDAHPKRERQQETTKDTSICK